MNRQIRILGISGSLRRESYNRVLLSAATQITPEGATIDIFEIDGIPAFSEDDEQNPPEKVVELKRRLRESDAVLFITPEYDYSIPGALKNAIDWASRPYGDSAWSGKSAAVMGASTGRIDTARAQYNLRQVMVFLNMFPLNQPEVMVGGANECFDIVGDLTDEQTREYVYRLVQSLVDWTRRTGSKEEADGNERRVQRQAEIPNEITMRRSSAIQTPYSRTGT